MSRRDYPLHFKCKHQGCTESVTYRYTRFQDLKESFELRVYGGDGWWCMRHRHPEEVLSQSNLETHFEAVSVQEGYGRFFAGQGFIHGPGFKLFAGDVPAGTKLVVSARIILPDETLDSTERAK